jgi:PAS domain S-box-containing protein
VVVVIYDITDRKRVEAENAKLAAIVECSDDAIFSETLDGIVTSWNPGAERLFGYSESAALGQSALMLVPPERRDEEQAILNRLRRRERVDHFETVRQRADGSRLDVSLTVSPITDDEGRILGASMIARDITERKRAEQDRSRQALVVENTGDFVGMWGRDGSLIYLNRAAREMVGLEQDEAMFRTSLGEFFFPEDRDAMVDEFIPHVLRAGRGEAEVRFRHFRTGEPLWVLFRVFLLRDDSGEPVGFATVSVNITERKRAEEALAIQNEVLDRIAAAAPLKVTLEKLLRLIEKQDSGLRAAICLLDPDGTHLRKGIAPSLPEAYSRAVDGVRIGEGSGACGTAAWRRKPVLVEDIMTDPMGVDSRPLAALLGFRSCWSSPLLDAQGRVLGTVAIYRDVAGGPTLHHERLMSLATHLAAIAIQRDREEQILRDSEKRFRVLAETLPQMVWTGDPDGALDFLSRRWTEFTGVGVELQLGSRWMGQVHPDDRNGLQDAWHAALRSGRDFRHEFRVRGRDGQYRWFDTRAVPLRCETGQIIKWFGSNTDITERRRAEELLRDQVARVGLLNQITRAIGERQDLTSIFQVVVRDLEAHFPLDLGCVCLCESGDKEISVSCLSRRSPELARLLEAAEPPRISIEANGLGPCLAGRLVHEPDLELSSYPLAAILRGVGLRSLVVAPLQVERQVFGVLMAARKDVHSFNSQDCEFLRQLSEHVALAAHQAQIYGALQQAYNDLRQTQETVLQQERLGALGQMASGIAHDINNAISPVALYTESLLEREPNLSDRARGYLGTIQRAIDDVAQTVARMREFCRKRRPQLELVPLNLNRLVWQVLELTRVRWNDMPQERGWMIRAQTDIQAELPEIQGVESEIRDALTNLILNAVDAMPEGGTLGIKTRVLGRESGNEAGPSSVRVMVEVSDTGMGMDETTRRRCLEPFFTTKGERGTGLGLAMVFGMVQRHGAQIDIESAPGLGTAIRLSFCAAPVASETPDGDALPGRLDQPLRLLVVDDDPLLLRSLLDTLEADGHEVVVAEGGEQGIEVFRRQTERGHRFDVVITDLGMPSVDGRKVAAAVKSMDPRTPVILLTGWGQRMGKDEEHPPHVDYRLGKPPKLPELRRALTHCAGLPSHGDGI